MTDQEKIELEGFCADTVMGWKGINLLTSTPKWKTGPAQEDWVFLSEWHPLTRPSDTQAIWEKCLSDSLSVSSGYSHGNVPGGVFWIQKPGLSVEGKTWGEAVCLDRKSVV